MRSKLLAGLLGVLIVSSLAAAQAPPVSGPQASLAARAAIAYVGGAYASIVRPGPPGIAWQFRVIRRDGSITDVLLDGNLELIDVGDSPSFAPGYRPQAPVAEYVQAGAQPQVTMHFAHAEDGEQPISQADNDRAGRAALEAAGGGRVRDVDYDRENGARYEVEVTTRDGRAVDILLDAQFKVIDLSGEMDARESSARSTKRSHH